MTKAELIAALASLPDDTVIEAFDFFEMIHCPVTGIDVINGCAQLTTDPPTTEL